MINVVSVLLCIPAIAVAFFFSCWIVTRKILKSNRKSQILELADVTEAQFTYKENWNEELRYSEYSECRSVALNNLKLGLDNPGITSDYYLNDV
ncbi:MAG: hypothetical protein K5662_05325 [Lachnospiraceae bacterium]|nr:hypothetical protein [Lachnospiraceae bacterium]